MSDVNRRNLLIGAAALSTALVGGARASGIEPPELTEDGLHRQPWFLDSFLELADDLETAKDAGKRFAVMWELKGCPYCREIHYVNFADPAINRYVRENFDILQLNIIGSRIVTDFDGEELAEKDLAKKYGVRFTPTFQFFPPTTEGLDKLAPVKREVVRAPGYLKPRYFMAMFRFVREKAYESESFRSFARKARG